jgi:hypothetical protein
MTMPDNPLQFLDPNNPLLSGGPARLDGGVIEHPTEGRMGGLSVRTGSTTCAVFMGADDLDKWAAFISGLADEVRGGPKLAKATMADVAALGSTMRGSVK